MFSLKTPIYKYECLNINEDGIIGKFKMNKNEVALVVIFDLHKNQNDALNIKN